MLREVQMLSLVRYISLNKRKILRRHAEALGYNSNFTILDTDDQKKLIRNIVKGEDLDAKKFSPQLIIYHIDQWKNKGLLPKDVKLENLDQL